MAVLWTQLSYVENTLKQLSDTFQQLEIDKGTSTSHTPISEGESVPYSIATMNDNTLSQTFMGVGYKPIHIKMYIRSMEKIVERVGKDKQDIEELCQLTFYNGLRAEARQWFDGLAIETQEDWGVLKSKFTKKFGLADMDKQQRLYFYSQVKALRQGNKQIPKYI